MKNFALIGAAGYIAPRHLEAIHGVGGNLIAAVDPHDSVGILDRYFPDARFFTEIERFDRFLEKVRRGDPRSRVEYLTVCSPNYLHDAHARLGLRVQCDVICEKPVAISPWNIDALMDLEHEHGRRIYTVLQLRLQEDLAALKRRLAGQDYRQRAKVCLTYVTRRGLWYDVSWKGDPAKSGGIAMNIGVHFFDLLLWLFGSCERSELHHRAGNRMAGFMELEYADVQWFLSLDEADLPAGHLEAGKPAHRSLTMGDEEIEFSAGFTDLHLESYRGILAGDGFGLVDARPSVALVHALRTADVIDGAERRHPLLLR